MTIHQAAYKAAEEALAVNSEWNQIGGGERNTIMISVGLVELTPHDLSTDENLLDSLDHRNLSAMRAEADAIPGRVAQAIERAAKLLEPKVQLVPLERATLKTQRELDAWLERQRTKLSDALKRGPVMVS